MILKNIYHVELIRFLTGQYLSSTWTIFLRKIGKAKYAWLQSSFQDGYLHRNVAHPCGDNAEKLKPKWSQ